MPGAGFVSGGGRVETFKGCRPSYPVDIGKLRRCAVAYFHYCHKQYYGCAHGICGCIFGRYARDFGCRCECICQPNAEAEKKKISKAVYRRAVPKHRDIRAANIIAKRLVMSQRRHEGACNRIADANVTFCEKGGMTEHMTDFSAKKNRNGAKSIPT